jgi:lipopolysaccharide transport system ATP-binding protein
MPKPVVVFDGVWKKFRMGERHDSLRDLIPSLLKRRSATALNAEEFWALQNVSFEVEAGQALGIIGPNGAGKSTTLKLLTRILKPTRGACLVRGRVGALIEVAAGFHPDLTGRENIFLQGAIMGMKRAEISRRLDEIVDFSGVERFLDTPVKRYSSGMQARLGFSVAAHLDPDVLFVDEVLSVGDMSFQAKCLERMREHVQSGTTLIFVSHNLQAVAALCKRAIVCARGEMLFDGPTEDAITVYLKASQTASSREGADGSTFQLLSAQFTADGGPTGALQPHSRCQLAAELECLRDCDDFSVGIELERTRDLLYCYGTTSEDLGAPLRSAKQGQRLSIRVDFIAHLSRGHYRLNLHVRRPSALTFSFVAESIANFAIAEERSYDGVVEIEPRISIEETDGSASAPYRLTVA